MAKINILIPELNEDYVVQNQRQITYGIETLVNQLNFAYQNDLKNEQDILKLLNPIIKSNSVWKNHVLKFLGDFYTSNNQIQKANQYYLLLLLTLLLLQI